MLDASNITLNEEIANVDLIFATIYSNHLCLKKARCLFAYSK